ncbi:hypothetical protein J6590_075330 [Homalodisca vitripennis]|nr:hypothetical protein J6590_075330 [Homalodisca vitripennis]
MKWCNNGVERIEVCEVLSVSRAESRQVISVGKPAPLFTYTLRPEVVAVQWQWLRNGAERLSGNNDSFFIHA